MHDAATLTLIILAVLLLRRSLLSTPGNRRDKEDDATAPIPVPVRAERPRPRKRPGNGPR
jgi:hypothetical protein